MHSLHTIGGHVRMHSDLTKLSPKELRFEIEGYKRALERTCRVSVTEFAYPFGTSYHVNDTLVSAVSFAGYARTYTAISRFVPEGQTYCTPCMCIETGLSPKQLKR